MTLTDVARLSADATKGSIIIFKNQHPEFKVLNGISATISEVEPAGQQPGRPGYRARPASFLVPKASPRQ